MTCAAEGVAPDPVNLESLGEVLVELGARLRGVDDDVPFTADASTLRRVENLTLTTRAGQIDLLAAPEGGPDYDTLRNRAERTTVGQMTVLVASPADLISMKRAAGRLKDLADIEELEAIGRLRA